MITMGHRGGLRAVESQNACNASEFSCLPIDAKYELRVIFGLCMSFHLESIFRPSKESMDKPRISCKYKFRCVLQLLTNDAVDFSAEISL